MRPAFVPRLKAVVGAAKAAFEVSLALAKPERKFFS